MTAAWDRITSTGSGKITGVRVSIEGWPYQFVSHASMVVTPADSEHTGQLVAQGLRAQGIRFGAHADPIAAELRGDSLRLQIADIGNTVTLALAKVPQVRTYLATELAAAATTVNVLSTAEFGSSGEVHIGTETIRYASKDATNFLGCTRGVWDTLDRKHFLADGASLNSPAVTDVPAIMEGRRVRVWAYAEGDELTGTDLGATGTQVWLGVAAGDPKWDGKFWTIPVDSIVRVLDQDVGGDLGPPVTPRGIYYSGGSPLRIAMWHVSSADAINFGVEPTGIEFINHYGFHETQEDFVDSLNAELATAVSNLSSTTTCRAVAENGSWHLEYQSAGTAQGLWCWVGSLVDSFGPTMSYITKWDIATETYIPVTQYQANSTYYQYQIPGGSYADQPTHAWGSVPRGAIISRPWATAMVSEEEATDPSMKVYISGGVAITSNTNAVLFNDMEMGVVSIDASNRALEMNADVYSWPRGFSYEEVRAAAAGITIAWVSDNLPTIRLGRAIAHGKLSTALQAIIDDAPAQIGSGALPMIQAGDFASGFGELDAASTTRLALSRLYWAFDAWNLAELIAHDCRMVGAFPTLDSAGKITFRRIRMAAQTEVADHAITTTQDLNDSNFANVEKNAMGVFNTVEIFSGYEARTERWNGPHFVVRDVEAFGDAPQSRVLEIKPLSRGTFGSQGLTLADSVLIGSRLFGVYGHPYMVATMEVPLTLFSAVIGDSVSLTVSNVPDTDGTLGLTAKRGIILGLSWSLFEARGTVDVLIHGSNVAGYAPACRVNDTTDHGGNLWTVTTVSPTSYFPTGTDATDWFPVGYEVRVFRWGSTTSGVVSGSVTAVTATTIQVQFDGAWTPGASDWVLGLETSDNVDTAERAFVFVASSDATMDWAGADTGSAFTLAS